MGELFQRTVATGGYWPQLFEAAGARYVSGKDVQGTYESKLSLKTKKSIDLKQ